MSFELFYFQLQLLLNPFANGLVCTLILGVLRLGKRHLVHSIAVLVGEYNHDVGAREVACYLVGQELQCVLVRHGALARGDYHKQIVGRYRSRQIRHLRPVRHLRVRHTHVVVTAEHIVLYQRQHILTTEELGVALKIRTKSAQTLKPAVEARLKLCSRRHCHLYAAYRSEGLGESRHDNLTVESVEQTLMELAPELLRHLRVHVHTDENLSGTEFLVGMAYAVGYVGSHTHLGLHVYVGGSRILCHALQQSLSLLLIAQQQ